VNNSLLETHFKEDFIHKNILAIKNSPKKEINRSFNNSIEIKTKCNSILSKSPKSGQKEKEIKKIAYEYIDYPKKHKKVRQHIYFYDNLNLNEDSPTKHISSNKKTKVRSHSPYPKLNTSSPNKNIRSETPEPIYSITSSISNSKKNTIENNEVTV